MGGTVGAGRAITSRDRQQLLAMGRSPDLPAHVARRAVVVVLAADGLSDTAIAAQLGMARPTVATWRRRWAEGGVAGLADAARTGRPRVVSSHDLLAATLRPPTGPTRRAGTWTTRTLGASLGVGHATVARAWQEHGLRPVGAGRLAFATVPVLEVASGRLVGLHLGGEHPMALLAVDGPTAEQAVRAVARGATGNGGSLALTSVQPPGALDVRAALQARSRAVTSVPTTAPAVVPAVTFLDAAGRARSTLLADARLHLVVRDAATLRDPDVRTALARLHPPLTTHLVSRSWTWPGLLAAWVQLGDRRPGASPGEHGDVDRLLADLAAGAAPGKAGSPFTWVSATRESLRRTPLPPRARSARPRPS